MTISLYQDRVAAAHHALFHDDPTDVAERLARFFEEVNETCQAFGMSREDAHKLVDYTYSRPVGDPAKEIGAAMLTLASLSVVAGLDLSACAEADLEKLQRPETIARIRAKRSTRHGLGPLPGFDPSSPGKDGGQPVTLSFADGIRAAAALFETAPDEPVDDITKLTREAQRQSILSLLKSGKDGGQSWDDPTLDGTDGAHPAWWRGCDHGYAKGLASVGKDGGQEDDRTEGFIAGYDEGLRQSKNEACAITADALQKAKSVLTTIRRGALAPMGDVLAALNAIDAASNKETDQ